ncbi:MAG: hypothetical protein N4A33_02505 [Bacteriovoracaceae bacterium]|nr:hypothetical protein [Bacteriovoracaceae bacterium]
MALIITLFSFMAYSMPVLHLFKPHTNFTQVVSQDTCSTFTKRRDSVGCNPALFTKNIKKGLTFFLGSKSDGESVDAGNKLVFESITKEFLEELFSKQNFNSWGGGTFLEFNTPYFYLSYDPVQVNADIFVFNPAFPEISLSLNTVKRLSITSGIKLDSLSNKNHTLNIGGTLFYYEHKFYNDTFSLAQLTSTDVDEIIKFKREQSIAADLALHYENNFLWAPSFSLILKNLNSHYSLDEDKLISENELQPILIYEQYSKANIGYDFYFSFGSINLETSFAFNKVFESFYNEYSALALSYSLGNFSTTASYSKYISNFGFKFESDSSSIGIYYSQIEALGDFSSTKESAAGFTFEVYL